MTMRWASSLMCEHNNATFRLHEHLGLMHHFLVMTASRAHWKLISHAMFRVVGIPRSMQRSVLILHHLALD